VHQHEIIFCTNLTHIAVNGLRDRPQPYTLRVVQTQADSALKRWNVVHNSYAACRSWLIFGLFPLPLLQSVRWRKQQG